MASLLTLICLVAMVIPAAVANIIAYPISKKWSMAISEYIQKVLAVRLFAILRTYRFFHFWGYKEDVPEIPEQFIIISNHQSLLDIPLFMNFFRDKELRFVSKDTLGRHVPLVSEMLRSQEHCVIPREAKPMEAMRYVEQFGKRVVERNQIPILFPEGSRTRDGNVGRFYSAGFRRIVEATGLPVMVCALDGGWRLRDLRRLFTRLKRGCYRVKILKVYDNPKTKEECNALLEESAQMIQKQVMEWRSLPSEVR
ncbi:MAG: 1-acyl-sn-glycerol-3-phosphate acyltransferase [Treponema sp.]|nr:1-acyl-sn-glycerol-3-phosphate acyltransferase [Treponema sp.]